MTNIQNEESSYVNLKLRKPSSSTLKIIIFAVIILAVAFFGKKYFIVATVNGSPISRRSFVAELERQGGKQTLDGMITEKLIENSISSEKDLFISDEVIDKEIKKVEEQLVSQGKTLKDVLEVEGLTEKKLRERITIQKKLEKLLESKTVVSDLEIDAYIKDNNITTPEGMTKEELRAEVQTAIKDQKLSQEIQGFVSELKNSATIKYY